MYRLLEQADASQGIAVTVLQQKPNWALVYVHRIAQLQKDLQKPGVSCFLEQYGYVDLCVEKALEHLQKRIAASDGFPMRLVFSWIILWLT